MNASRLGTRTHTRLVAALLLGSLVAAVAVACGGQSETAPAEPAEVVAATVSDPAPEPAVSPSTAAPDPEPEPLPEPVPPPPVEAEPPTPSPAQSVTSDDGLLTVDVPEGATADPSMEVSVRALGPDELPPELAGLELRGTLHELEPDGATFEAPVAVTRQVDTEALGVDLSEGTPLIVLLSRSADGSWDVLADQSITIDGTMATVSGTTTHFTTVVAFSGAALVSMRPDNVKRKVKRGWTSESSSSSSSSSSAAAAHTAATPLRARGADGATLLDTADVYCRDEHDIGHNERLVAHALASWSGHVSEVTVATKGGSDASRWALGSRRAGQASRGRV